MMKVQITTHEVQLHILLPEFNVSEEVLKEDSVNHGDNQNGQRVPTNVYGAPELHEFKEIQEEKLESASMIENETEPETKKGFWLFSLFRKKKSKQGQQDKEIDFSPDSFETVILDEDIPFITLRSSDGHISDMIVYDDIFPIGRMIEDLADLDYISKCHGLIYVQDYQHIFFGDCSRNLNRINGQGLKHYRYYPLYHGDLLTLGRITFKVEMNTSID